MGALTVSDLSMVTDEPRIRDLLLAEQLGFTDPHKIRNLIARYRAELILHGALVSVAEADGVISPVFPRSGKTRDIAAPQISPVSAKLAETGDNPAPSPETDIPGVVRALLDTTGWSQAKLAERLGVNQNYVSRYLHGREPRGRVMDALRRLASEHGVIDEDAFAPAGERGGRPGTAYFLNEEQALLVCMFSRTERAVAVRTQVIKVYLAWRRGELERNQPDPRAAEIAALRRHAVSLTAKHLDRLRVKERALELRDEAVAAGFGLAEAVRMAAAETGVSAATIYNWSLAARGVPQADRAAALAPQYRATAKHSPIHPDGLAWFVRRLLASRRGSFSECYRALVAVATEKGWSPIPSERSLRRRIEALRPQIASAEIKLLAH